MLILRDYTTVKLPNRFLNVNDSGQVVGEFDTQQWLVDNATALEDQAEGVGLVLNKVLTSMSGVLINRRVYPGEEWKKSAPFFAERPYLLHHKSWDDAVGRISYGEFEQKRQGRPFENDWKRPIIQEMGKTPRPSGIVYTGGVVSDPDVIAQVNDKRVLHVSQGSRAKIGECSICKADWGAGHFCDHMPGMFYSKETGERVAGDNEEAELAYSIIREIIPIEVSFVTDPALEQARILEYGNPMDDATQDSWNRLTSEINNADTIIEDSMDQMVLVDRNGDRTILKLVDEKTANIKSDPTPTPEPKKVPVEAKIPETNKDTNQNLNKTADKSKVVRSNTGERKMDWEAKYTEKHEELLDLKGEFKDAQIEVEKTKNQITVKDGEIKSLKDKIEASDSKIASLEEKLKDEQGENKKLLELVRGVYLDRYVIALRTSRPDLSDEEVKSAREELSDKPLDAIKLLVSDKEKFAKAPLETKPSEVDPAKVTDSSVQEPKKSNETEEEEDDDDFSL